MKKTIRLWTYATGCGLTLLLAGWSGTCLSQQFQWEEQVSGTTQTLYGSGFADGQTGWIVGGNDGLLFERQNSGLGSSAWLEKVEAVSENTAWVLNSGDVIKTTDGGKTWVGKPGYFESVSFVDENKGWGITNSTNISVTTDGGEVWTLQKSGSNFLYWIHAFDSQHCWAVGSSGAILATKDGGANWVTQTSGTPNALNCVYFVNDSTGWAVGAQGTILKTTNGGDTWLAQSGGTTEALNSVHFADPLHGGIAADRATVLYTTDGGATWNVKSGLKWPQYDLASIRYRDSNTAFAVGVFGTILKTADGGVNWTSIAAGTTAWLNGIDIEGESVWIVGNSSTILKMAAGFIAKTSDGGTHWTKQTSGTSSTLYAVHCHNQTTAWACGGEGTILRTTDGGTTWSPQNSGQNVALYDLFFLDNQIGWIAGQNGTLLKTVNGGSSWDKLTSGTTEPLYSLFFADALKGYATGSFGTLMKTLDGGTTWTKTGISVHDLRSVFFTSPDTGFVCGINGTLLKTTDGGGTWKPLTPGITENFFDIRFTGPNTGWMAGTEGTILKTTTGGEMWINQLDSAGTIFRSVFAVTPAHLYACGTGGKIIRSTGDEDLTAPDISVSQPVPGQRFVLSDLPILLKGTVTDVHSAVCTVNGEYRTLYAGALETNLYLSPFDSSVVIRASDQAGNLSEKIIPVEVDIDLPAVSRKYYLGSAHDLTDAPLSSSMSFNVSYYTEPWTFEFTRVISDPMLINRVGYAISFYSGTRVFNLKWIIGRGADKTVVSQTTVPVATAGLYSGNLSGKSYLAMAGDTLKLEITGAYLGGFGWGVGASGGYITVESDKASFLSPPVLLSPASGSPNQPTSLTLKWRAVADAVSYRIQVDDNSGFSNPDFSYSGVTDTFRIISGLSYNKTYAWRVTASSASDTSAWSESRNFTTAAEVNPPTLQASSVVASDTGNDHVSLSWTAGNGSRSVVFVRQGTEGTPGPADGTTFNADTRFGSGSQIGTSGWYCVYLGSGNATEITGLEPVTSYKVMVLTLNGDAGYEKYLRETAAGNPITFRTSCDYDYYGTNPAVHLYFKDPATYDVEITNTHSCATTTYKFLNISLTGNSFTINSFPYPTTGSLSGTLSGDGNSFSGVYDITYSLLDPIYGYVIPCGTLAGSWSASRKTAAPAVPVMTSPLNGVADQPFDLNLNWNPSPGAVSYSLQVSTTDDFAAPVVSQNDIVTDYFHLEDLDPSIQYYWRVSANNECFSSGWAEAWSFTTLPQPPGIPDLILPENNSTDLDPAVTFSWNASERAVSYTLQVSYFFDFDNSVVNQSGITQTSLTPGGLSNNSTYYWRVCAVNSGGTSNWSEIRNFTTKPAIPAIPELVSPPNNSTSQPLRPLLTWHAADKATSYKIVIATDPDFDYLVVSRPSLTDTTYTPVALMNGTKYYWHVRSNSGTAVSQYSETWSFSVIEAVPASPSLLLPADHAANQPLTLSLNWNASERASSYTLQVSNLADFSTLLINQEGLTSVQFSPQGLVNGTLYYWRVNAVNTGGTSPWSEIRSFTVIPAVSDVPTLVSPVNLAVDQPVSLTLTWNAPAGATGYTLQVSESSGFTTTVINQTGLTATSFMAGGLGNGSTYYWRVNAVNAGGTSEWSEVRSFTTIPAPPDIPVLASPADNAADQPMAVVLAWNSAARAASYAVQVSEMADFSSFVVNQSGLTAPGYTPAGLAYNTTYYWRVNASNTGGSSSWSQTRSFTTVPALPATPTLASPPNHSAGQPLSPSLSWNPSSGAISYSVQIAPSFDFATVIASQSGITATNWTPPPLALGTRYFWRVNATNTGGTTAWCGEWDFTTTTGHNDSVETRTIIRYLQPDLTFSKDPYLNDYDQDIYVNNYVLEWKDTLTSDTLGKSFILNLIGGSQGLYGSILSAEILIKTIQGEISVVAKDFSASCFYTLPNYNIYPRKMNVEMTGVLPAFQSGDILLLRVKVKSGAAGRIMYGTTAGTNYLKILGTLKTPTLSSPSDETTNVTVNPLFAWVKSDAATSYHLQVSALPDFSTTSFSDTNIVVTSQQVGNLEYSTKYFWRVKAKNFTGSSNWSEVWEFTTTTGTQVPALQAGNLVFSGIGKDKATVGWTRGDGSRSIVFVRQGSGTAPALADNSSYTDHPAFGSGSEPGGSGWYCAYLGTGNETTITGLAPQTTYAVMVITLNGEAGDEKYLLQTISGNPAVFTTLCDPDYYGTLPAVHLHYLSPSSFDVEITNSHSCGETTLTFNDIHLSGNSFSITVSAYPNTGSMQGTLSADGNSFTGSYQINYAVLHPQFGYSVPCGTKSGSWSAVRSAPGPGIPVPASPAGHAVNQPVDVTLRWEASAGALFYSVELSKNSSFSPVTFSGNNITGTEQTTTGLEPNTTYYWRVAAGNACYLTHWSSIRDFTTGSAVTAEFARKGAIRLYPNPARERVLVECTLPVSGNALVRMYDRAGRLVLSEEFMQGTTELEVSTLRRGLYLVEILTERALFRQKLVLY